jgi:hypothetical protein
MDHILPKDILKYELGIPSRVTVGRPLGTARFIPDKKKPSYDWSGDGHDGGFLLGSGLDQPSSVFRVRASGINDRMCR